MRSPPDHGSPTVIRKGLVQSQSMRFEVLGPLQIARDGAVLALTSRRQVALLANLLVADGKAVPAESLIEAVWGHDLPSDPTNTLQHAISQLRKLVEPERRPREAATVLISSGSGYRLDLVGHEFDADEFSAGVEQTQQLLDSGQVDEAQTTIDSALALWRGEAYADIAYEDYARPESERLAELRANARELRVEVILAHQGPEAAVPELESLVAEYPYREALWGRLMKALYQSGRQADALRVYRQAAKALGDELGIEPSPELQQLEDQILLQDPDLARQRTDRPKHNLPALSSSLVGRDDLVNQYLEYTATSRLVTLLGPGGCGKTRLALEIGEQNIDAFDDGVWLVRLDNLSDPALLIGTVGIAVGMPEDRDLSAIDTLIRFLSTRHTMIILDNCEHLLEAVADLVNQLLLGCPTLSVVATSQVALGVTGEQRLLVPPLRLPTEADLPFDDLEASPAVQLFLERAGSIDPNLDVSAPSIAAIANIVERLDGIPLAIELAAARASVLTPTELARLLVEHFDELGDGPRDAPTRQRTLSNTIEWSIGLLNKAEQDFFLGLATFSGGFDARAAAAVTATTDSYATGIIGRLVERSVVTRQPAVHGTSRYRLLQTVRQFAEDQLKERGDYRGLRDRHLDHFSELAFELDAGLMDERQLAAFAQFVAEEDNLRTAMSWSLNSERLEPGVRLAARSGRFWDWRGSLAEGTTWTTRFLAAIDVGDIADLAFLTTWAGYFAWELGDIERAYELNARAKAIASENGDDYGYLAALSGEALHARVGGDHATAVATGAEMRQRSSEQGDQWLEAWTDNHDSLALIGLNDLDAAQGAAERSLQEFRALGDDRASGWALTGLALVWHERGDSNMATALALEAAAVSQRMGDGRNATWALEIAAEASRAADDESAALRYEAEAASLLEERGMPMSPWRRLTS